MGGSTTQRQTQTSSGTASTAGNPLQQQNIDLLMRGARDFYNTGGPQYYPNQTYAGPTPGELLGRRQAVNYATGAGQDYINAAQAGDRFWLNPENIFDPSRIPGFSDVQAGITRDVTRNLTESVLPELRGGSIAQGALGGSRQEIGEGLAAARTSEQIADALAGMNVQAYGQGLNMYNAAAGRAPAMAQLGLLPAEVLQQMGGLQRADEQQAIDADMARFNWEQMAPYFNLEMLRDIIGTVGQYGTTVNTEEFGEARTRQSGDNWQQGLGTAIAIASLFSHSSLKMDITPATGILQKLQSLQIYNWRYKGGGVAHIGPMAEEFHETFGVGDGITLNIFDLLGVLLGAVRELSLKGAN